MAAMVRSARPTANHRRSGGGRCGQRRLGRSLTVPFRDPALTYAVLFMLMMAAGALSGLKDKSRPGDAAYSFGHWPGYCFGSCFGWPAHSLLPGR